MALGRFKIRLIILSVSLLAVGALAPALSLDNGLAYSQNGESANSAPISRDDTLLAQEDTPITLEIQNFTFNDYDPDWGLVLNRSLDPNNITSLYGASLSENGLLITYMPDQDFYGRDSFKYTTSDSGGAADTATVHVLVSASEDAPIADDDTFTVYSNVTTLLDILANDFDSDGLKHYAGLPEDTDGAAGAAAQDFPSYGYINSKGTFVAYYGSPNDLPRRVSGASDAAGEAEGTPLGTTYARMLEAIPSLKQAVNNAKYAVATAQAEYAAKGGSSHKSNETVGIASSNSHAVLEENLKAAHAGLSKAQRALDAGYARLKASPSLYGLLAEEKNAADPRLGLLEGGGASDEHSPMAPARVTMKQGHSPQELLRMESDGIRLVAHHGQAAVIHVSADGLDKLVQLDSVAYASVPKPARTNDHHRQDGTTFARANLLHGAGINGSGITVAIIDSSFVLSDPIFDNRVSHMSLHDSAIACGGSIECNNTFQSSHGTAVAGTVLDVAPDVTLELYVIYDPIDFVNATNEILARGEADIVTTSLGFGTEGGAGPLGWFRDGTSASAKAVDKVRAEDVLFTVAAGNEGLQSWRGAYVPSLTVSPSEIMLDSIAGKASYQSVMEFSPNASGTKKACLPVSVGEFALMSWNEWPDTPQDYDLFLYDSNMSEILDYSAYNQSSLREPLELIHDVLVSDACLVAASYNSTQDQWIYVEANPNIQIPDFSSQDKLPNVRPNRLSYPSIGTPADARGATTVGAVYYSIGVLESISSIGPTDDGRPKPEICGPDGAPAINMPSFFGTSAAAPHVAGGAALLMQLNPDKNATEIEALLLSGADKSIAYQAQDNVCGAGSLSMLDAFYSDPISEIINASSGGPLRVSAVTEPAHGTAKIADGGSAVEYRPDAGYLGPDSFEYTVSDPEGMSDTAAVSVTVSPPRPTVSVSRPLAGEQIAMLDPVLLEASAADANGTDISHSIAWRSDVAGYLGSGGSVLARLPHGDHVITAHAADSAGTGSSASVAASVSPERVPGGPAEGPVVEAFSPSGLKASVAAANASQLPDASGVPAGFPDGLLEWSLSGMEPGSSGEIRLHVREGYPPSAVYWAVAGGAWADASTSLKHDPHFAPPLAGGAGAAYTLTVRDGGPYDSDGAADGSASGYGGIGIADQRSPDPSASAAPVRMGLGGDDAAYEGGRAVYAQAGLEVSASGGVSRAVYHGEGALGAGGPGSALEPGEWMLFSFGRPVSQFYAGLSQVGWDSPDAYEVLSYDSLGELVSNSTARAKLTDRGYGILAGAPGASAVRIAPLEAPAHVRYVLFQDHVARPHYPSLESAMAARFSFDEGDARNSAGPQFAYEMRGVEFQESAVSGLKADFSRYSGYIDVGYAEDLGFGSGSYAVSAWVTFPRDRALHQQLVASDTTAKKFFSEFELGQGWAISYEKGRKGSSIVVHEVADGEVLYRGECGFSCRSAGRGGEHHVGISVDAYENTATFWYDGKVVSRADWPLALAAPDESVGLRIGGVPGELGYTYSLRGGVDELILFDRPLSEGEMGQLASRDYYRDPFG